MDSATPQPPRRDPRTGRLDTTKHGDGRPSGSSEDVNVDVGSFEQGTEFSRWALARYIVGRVVLERVSWSLLVVAAVLLVVGGLCEWGLHSTFLAVVAVLLALIVLAMRAVLRAVLRRLMSAGLYGPLEQRVREITNDAGGGVLTEMRRVGLPARIITLPLLLVRLIGKRRKETLGRMREFDVERAVPKAKRDELYLVLRQGTGLQQPPTQQPPTQQPPTQQPPTQP